MNSVFIARTRSGSEAAFGVNYAATAWAGVDGSVKEIELHGPRPSLITDNRQATEICYRGFAYNVRSEFGIDSLRTAIRENGDD